MTLQQLSDILKGFYALQGEAQSITRDDLAKFLVEKGIVRQDSQNSYRLHKWLNVKTKDFNYSIQIKVDGTWVHLLTGKTPKKSIYKTKEEATSVLNYIINQTP